MAEYQQIEYRIGKDGKIVETVLHGSGRGCIEVTAPLEQALGEIEVRELLPEYDNSDDLEGGEIVLTEEIQTLQQR